MTESASTHSKTLSDTIGSESTGDIPLVADRWTNNISYRQLVMSSCVGITQLWWHPYLNDLGKLLPFLFLYNVFSIFVGYPLFYLELSLGAITKKGVLSCWDLSPVARGVGVAMVWTCALSALCAGAVCARCLALLVHSAHAFLPWLHCAAAAHPACAARHRPLTPDAETPAQSFYFNYVLKLKREGLDGGLGNVVWELTIYLVISWTLIYFIAVKRIYSYSKLVLFKDVLTYLVLACAAVGAARLDGAAELFRRCDWTVLYDLQMWREAIEYSLLQLSVGQGSLVMLGSLCPDKRHRLAATALLSAGAAQLACAGGALTLGAVHGALLRDYDADTINMRNGISSSMILWADFVARVPGSQFWSILVFFTLFVLALCSAALLVQTMISTFTARSLRKITWAFLILICFLSCLISIMTLCTQGGMYILNFLMSWPVSRPRLVTAAATAAFVTYVYGQSAFCEELYFAVAEYPGVFHRVSWALSPLLLVCAFLTGTGPGSAPEPEAGWVLVALNLLPIGGVMLAYFFFKCRVRNIVRNEKS